MIDTCESQHAKALRRKSPHCFVHVYPITVEVIPVTYERLAAKPRFTFCQVPFVTEPKVRKHPGGELCRDHTSNTRLVAEKVGHSNRLRLE
jgi:hypothetical protein